MSTLRDPRPMAEFDPDRPARVHDRLNDRVFDWEPGWSASYRRDVRAHEPGVVEWDGLLLDGWEPAGALQ